MLFYVLVDFGHYMPERMVFFLQLLCCGRETLLIKGGLDQVLRKYHAIARGRLRSCYMLDDLVIVRKQLLRQLLRSGPGRGVWLRGTVTG